MRARPLAVGMLVLATVGACSGSPSPTVTPPQSTRASTAQEGALPPGCEPIDLSSPDGERIVLDGTWAEVGTDAPLMTWYISTAGDCVWGAGQIEDVPPAESSDVRPDHVQSLAGRMGSDFVITGEILNLAPCPCGGSRYSALRMFVDFDDSGEILLREDREPGVSGPRCPDPGGYCPAPLVLQRVD